MRGVVAALAVLVVAGCGAHPGVAAVVGGQQIDVQTVDEISSAYCAANRLAARQQGAAGAERPTRDMRRGVLNALIYTEVAERAAGSLGVSVPSSEVAAEVSAAVDTLPAGLPAGHEERITGLLGDLTRAEALVVAIGEELLAREGEEAADPEAAFQRGQRYVTAYADRLGIEVDPRFGEYTLQGVVERSGSLSVPVSQPARTLPASQTCG